MKYFVRVKLLSFFFVLGNGKVGLFIICINGEMEVLGISFFNDLLLGNEVKEKSRRKK